MNWEGVGHRIAEEVLPEDLCVHDFKVIYSRKSVHLKISLDNVKNPMGSPTLAECASYSRVYNSRLEEFIQNQGAESSLSKAYTIEISSPGAQRKIKVPDELNRFYGQPMKVKYYKNNNDVQWCEVLMFRDFDENSQSLWQIADTKFNQKQGKIKKNKISSIFKIPLSQIKQVNLFIDT